MLIFAILWQILSVPIGDTIQDIRDFDLPWECTEEEKHEQWIYEVLKEGLPSEVRGTPPPHPDC